MTQECRPFVAAGGEFFYAIMPALSGIFGDGGDAQMLLTESA